MAKMKKGVNCTKPVKVKAGASNPPNRKARK